MEFLHNVFVFPALRELALVFGGSIASLRTRALYKGVTHGAMGAAAAGIDRSPVTWQWVLPRARRESRLSSFADLRLARQQLPAALSTRRPMQGKEDWARRRLRRSECLVVAPGGKRWRMALSGALFATCLECLP